MGIREPGFDLHEMQMQYEQAIRHVRTISDLELSENDYRRLGIKLKSLFAFAKSSNFADDFMLCLVIYWTYAHIYRDERYMKLNEDLTQSFRELSQYTQRHHLNMFLECFHDFGLNSYQIATGDLEKDCRRVTACHAGVPYDEQGIVFDLISRYLSFEGESLLRAIQPMLPKKTRRVLGYMDRRMQYKIVNELQSLLLALEAGTSRDAVLEEFPDLSRHLILNCVDWHTNQSLERIIVEI